LPHIRYGCTSIQRVNHISPPINIHAKTLIQCTMVSNLSRFVCTSRHLAPRSGP
jgi:hypothetical protein